MGRTYHDWSNLKELYVDKQLSGVAIAELKGCPRRSVYSALHRENIPLRPIADAMKLAYKSGRHILTGTAEPKPDGHRSSGLSHNGYSLIKSSGHPRAHKNFVFEHILVWEKVHGKPVPSGWEVHHLNGIKSDNRPSNLKALPSRQHKLVLAAKAQRIRELEEENRLLRRALEDGQMIFTISEN